MGYLYERYWGVVKAFSKICLKLGHKWEEGNERIYGGIGINDHKRNGKWVSVLKIVERAGPRRVWRNVIKVESGVVW